MEHVGGVWVRDRPVQCVYLLHVNIALALSVDHEVQVGRCDCACKLGDGNIIHQENGGSRWTALDVQPYNLKC